MHTAADVEPRRAAPARPSLPIPWVDLRNLYIILAGCVALLVLLPPEHEYPIIDDWIYAGSVRHQVDTGDFAMPPQSQANLVGLALWGTLWARLFGVSYTTLTYSTLALALVGLLAFYGLARRVGTPPNAALLGAGLLAVNPLFLHLSASFMTDVPFLALVLVACYGYVRGLQHGQWGWLLVAGVCAGWGFLIRQFAILVPAGFVGYLLLEGLPARRWRRLEMLAVIGPPALIVLGWAIWSRDTPTTPFTIQADQHRAAFVLKPAWVEVFLLRALTILPLTALSAWAAIILPRRRWWLVALWAVLVAGAEWIAANLSHIWIANTLPPFTFRLGPLALDFPQQTYPFGSEGSILREGGIDFFQYRQALIWSPEAWHLLLVLGLILGVLLLAKMTDSLITWLRAWWRERDLSPLSGVYLTGLATFGVTLALGGDFYDRYLLGFVAFVILFVVRGAAGWSRRAWAYTLVVFALWAGFSVLLRADSIDHDNARWQAALWLSARAGPVQMGFDWNNVYPAGNGTYEITDVPIAGFRTEARFPYTSRLSGFSTRYVLAQARADRPPLPAARPGP
jgi:4-amino-4-deoxy-L-arabinose transferase-like glycosyltransferase